MIRLARAGRIFNKANYLVNKVHTYAETRAFVNVFRMADVEFESF